MVVDIAELRPQAVVVEGVGADEPNLFLGREDELDSGVRAVLGEHAAHALEHRDDGRLVVRAEDRPAGVPYDAVLDDRLQRSGRRHRVEVGAEEERRAPNCRLETDVDVPHGRPDRRAAVVFVRVEAQPAEVAEHDVRDRPLLPRRARDRCELQKKRESLPVRYSHCFAKPSYLDFVSPDWE